MIGLLILAYTVIAVLIGVSIFDKDDSKALVIFFTVTWPIWFLTIYVMMAFSAASDIAHAASEFLRGD